MRHFLGGSLALWPSHTYMNISTYNLFVCVSGLSCLNVLNRYIWEIGLSEREIGLSGDWSIKRPRKHIVSSIQKTEQYHKAQIFHCIDTHSLYIY